MSVQSNLTIVFPSAKFLSSHCVFTPEQCRERRPAGALGASLALIICFARGRAHGAMMKGCLLETMTVTAFVFLIVTGANIITSGYDAIWFGVVLVIMAEVGLIHPPMGMNLYVLQGIGKTLAMRTIAIGALPLLGAMFATIALLYAFPDIALFLPRHVN